MAGAMWSKDGRTAAVLPRAIPSPNTPPHIPGIVGLAGDDQTLIIPPDTRRIKRRSGGLRACQTRSITLRFLNLRI